MSDETAARLHATTDAEVWAREWVLAAKLIEAAEDEREVIDIGWMIGWFANAIETGRNAGRDFVAPIAAEALLWALQHHVNQDQANAAIHCAPPKYSPITFRLAVALAHLAVDDPLVAKVIEHQGAYEEDRGR